MKMFMKILISTFVVSFLLSMIPFESTCKQLEKDVLRLHIIANSDSVVDQNLKLLVRDSVQDTISPLYNDANSKADALKITAANLDLVESVAQNAIKRSGFDYNVSAKIENKFFDTRYYENFTMPAGMYDALVIDIGDAKGRNWWCVMYPALCVGASSKITMKEDLSDSEYSVITDKDVVFKFKIVEYFEKINSLFR
ncbi:MAG: stage II sporulation protein R [Ruminococcus sp.]|nr:stage II sporulation protein R [Ruminococcus sp.]